MIEPIQVNINIQLFEVLKDDTICDKLTYNIYSPLKMVEKPYRSLLFYENTKLSQTIFFLIIIYKL